MKVHELIKQLQQLGIERQNDEVTVIHMDFPCSVRAVEVEPAAVNASDHYWIDYYPEVHDVAEDGPLVSVVVIR